MKHLYESQTGYDGKKAWKELHKVIDKEVWCDHCNQAGHKAMDFLEDYVRVKTRRAPKKYTNYMTHRARICKMQVKKPKICRNSKICNL